MDGHPAAHVDTERLREVLQAFSTHVPDPEAPLALVGREAERARVASLPSGTWNLTEPAAAFWAKVSRSSSRSARRTD